MKNIGISDETYALLLKTKHDMEVKTNTVLSFDKIIKEVIGEMKDEGKGKDIKK